MWYCESTKDDKLCSQCLKSGTTALMYKNKYSFLKLNSAYKGQFITASEKQISFQRIEDVVITCSSNEEETIYWHVKDILYSVLSRFKFSTCQVLLMQLVKKET